MKADEKRDVEKLPCARDEEERPCALDEGDEGRDESAASPRVYSAPFAAALTAIASLEIARLAFYATWDEMTPFVLGAGVLLAIAFYLAAVRERVVAASACAGALAGVAWALLEHVEAPTLIVALGVTGALFYCVGVWSERDGSFIEVVADELLAVLAIGLTSLLASVALTCLIG